MKRLIFSILFLSLFLLVHAIPSSKYQLVVRTASGDTAFILSQQPEISFTDKDVVVSNTETTITIPKTEFIEFLFAPYNKRMVRFVDWDGTLLQSSYVNLGEVPEYHGETPYRNDEFIDGMLYKYVFCGWGAELSAVTDDVTYTAQYTLMLVEYRVNYYDWDSTLLQSNLYYYGDWPTYYGTTPEREADAQYTYTFTGWSPQLDWVTGTASYYAQYEATLNQYEVTFLNWDGSVLQSTMVNYSEMPSYNSAIPTRDSDAQYTYIFTGWGDMSIVTGNQSYTAQYESTLNQYEVTFYNWDGEVLQSTVVNYGELPSYTGATPTRESDAQYTYTFTGWSPELSIVTSNQSYTAQYEATLNQYEVIFYNWDGSVLQSTMVNYGEMPVYEAATPTKPEDEHYIYTFFGWEPEITIVISEAEYTAQYEETEKTISSVDNAIIDQEKPHKVFIDGKLFIIHGEHIYSGQGHQIK